MKLFSFLLATCVLTLAWVNKNHAREAISAPPGPYLGQVPPDLTPKPFAPGIANTEFRELTPFFSPDMDQFYLVREGGKYEKFTLMVFNESSSGWRESFVMHRIGRPIFTPDGNTLLLGKKYAQRTENGWSDVKDLHPILDGIRVMRLTASSFGTFAFDEVGSRKGDGVLRFSRILDGIRQPPKAFPPHINKGKFSAHPFIAPDESYLVWDAEKSDGYGEQDLYISFRQQDGTWGRAMNMGSKINTSASEGGGYVTPDGKYFFFTRNINQDNYRNVDIFWVSTKIFNRLTPD